MARGSVTIQDVAEAAGVSRQTVSRVINRGPNVKPAVRERIEAAIERLGYVPNLSARRMGGAKSFLILAINDRQRTYENWQAGRGNDWVDQMLYGGMTECEKHGYHMVFELIDTEPAQASRQLSRVITELRPDGVILTPPHSDNPELADLLAKRGIACARIGRTEGESHVDVCMDEAGAGAAATAHLAELGHTQIGYLAGSPDYGNSRTRLEGYREVLGKIGSSAHELWVGKGDFQFETAKAIARDWLTPTMRPTAIIADNDQMAFAVLHVADRLGLRVPEDLSLISFEDTPGVRLSVPPMTAIRQPTSAMIAKACDRLIAASAGEDAKGCYELPYELIKRASTARPGSSD